MKKLSSLMTGGVLAGALLLVAPSAMAATQTLNGRGE